MELRPLCVMLLLMGLSHCIPAGDSQNKETPAVIIKPDTQVFTGETVTFRCDIQEGGDTEWIYEWNKDDTWLQDTTQEFSISPVTVSHGGNYTCRRNDPQLSQISGAVTLSVSAKPKPTVRVNPQSSFYTGDRVTLSCDLQSPGWTFLFYEDQKSIPLPPGTPGANTLSVTVSNEGRITYYCKAQRGNYESDYSDPAAITVRVRPKPVVKVQPAESVFIGERVTLTCQIQTGGSWQYHWYRDNNVLSGAAGKSHTFTVTDSNKGDYTCKGTQASDPKYTETSDAVTLTVSEKPQSELTSGLTGDALTGNSVTLTCTLKPQSDGWTFYWIIGRQRTATATHSINSITVSDRNYYSCYAGRGNPVYYTHSSKELFLDFTESPKPEVIINPDTQVFRGERVTFRCNIQSGGDTVWTYSWYRDGHTFYPHSTTQEFSISSVTDTDGGKYTCRGRRSDSQLSQFSHPVTLSVSAKPKPTVRVNPATVTVRARPKPVVKVQPAKSVFIGESVTLTCDIQPGGSWQYHWYRDNTKLSDAAGRKSYRIPNVKKSNKGAYTCDGTQASGTIYTETSDAATLTVSAEKPKPELTSGLNGAVLTGNSVTLKCTLKLKSAGWKFYWNRQSTETETETQSYNISSVKVSDGGQYRCRAGRGNPVYYTHYSDALWVNVTESTKAVVTIKPDNHVFRGERVTLRCDIQGGGDTEWTYSWYKNNNTLYPDRTTQEFSLSSVRNDNSGKYTCRGRRSSDSHRSEISDAVTLTVSATAESVVSVSPLMWLTEGDSVTLSCEVKHSSTGWTFSWYTGVPYRDSQGSLRYSTALLSDSSRGSGGSYTLSPVTRSHTGVYMCRAKRGEPVFHTHYSKPQPLCVTGESPPVSLIVSPSRTQHFTADSLSLSCEDQRDSTGWTVRGHTNETLYNCSSVSESICNISSLSTSHTGVYWCQSESGGRSNPLNITVHNGDVILDSPVHPVTEGNPLTLRCLNRNTKISDSGVDFYKDDSVLQKHTTGEMTISSVSKSDEGFYHCKLPERGESPKSWGSVRVPQKAPLSALKLLSSLVAASPYVLVTIILAVNCYRARTEPEEYNRSCRVIEAEASF